MKYIRTEDGIYTLITKDEPIYELNGKKYYCVEEQISSFSEDNIIKQSDNIEDLCDRFIVEYENGSFTIFNDFKDLKRHFYYYPQDYHKVTGRYGAIYVKGRGLICVAKMNSEGELELL